MPGIILGNQTNSTPVPPPSLQNWLLSPPGYTIVYYQGGDSPPPLTVQTQFRDIIGTSSASGMSNFRYKAYVEPMPSLPSCVVMDGPLYTGTEVYHTYTNGISGDMIYSFQNLNLMPVGVYNILCRHKIYGQISASNYILDEKTFTVQLIVLSASSLSVTPSAFDFAWTVGQEENISIPITVSGPIWEVRCPAGLMFEDIDNVAINQLPGGGYVAGGGGTKTFALVCTPAIQPSNITVNPLHLTLTGGNGIIQRPITVTFLQESGFFLEKNYLYFVAYKGVQEAYPQYVHMHFPGDYIFVCPPWMSILPSLGSYTFNAGFWPLNTDNMEAGHYVGQIEIRKSEGNLLLATVDVVYDVISSVGSPYPETGNAFTLDPKFIELVSQIDNTYFDVVLNARVYDFYTNNFQDFTINFKYALLNRRQRFNIGQLMHRLMMEMPDFSQESETPYLPATVSLQITERSSVDANYSQESELHLQFIAGIEPVLVSGSGFLDQNTGASRITPSGYFYLNMLINGYPTLRIKKNGSQVNYFGLEQGIKTLKMQLSDFDAKQGDVFELKLESGEESVSKFVKVIPEGMNSNYIVWENEYKLKSVMEFTGDYLLKSDFENTSQTLLQQLVEVLVKLESKKTAKLTINTGWILKSDVPSIESLCRAKRAALVLPGQIINLVPSQKSIVNVDSNLGLISYDVEFDVNRKFNEEIHSF